MPPQTLKILILNVRKLDYIKDDIRNLDCEYVMSNNFAFGGINTALIFKRWD